MKKLLILLVPIWVFSSTLFSMPVQIEPPPPVADPTLPTEQDPILPSSSGIEAVTPALNPAPMMTMSPPEVCSIDCSDATVRVVHHQDLNKKILVALIVASSLLGGIFLLFTCFWVCRLKRLKKHNLKNNQNSEAEKGLSLGQKKEKFSSLKPGAKKGVVAFIEYELLVAATSKFDERNIVGEGGLGCVYKAQFGDKFHAAVKRLEGEGEDADRIFENEMDWLSKLRHQNIVSLLGYCIHDDRRFMVYEMMHNGSLDFQLHGPSRGSALTWHLRMKIALDIARAMEYLHEHCNPPVIHRDLKSSNILLDSSYNAKVSDFGLAINGGNANMDDIKLIGTLGYVAPEYLLDGNLTDKSDVYAFGVILLELLMGRRPVEKVADGHLQSIVTWAMPQLKDRSKLPSIIDPVIRDTMDLKHLFQVAAVAVLCVQPEPSYRPLITDVLHSFIPLVPVELGGSLKSSVFSAP